MPIPLPNEGDFSEAHPPHDLLAQAYEERELRRSQLRKEPSSVSQQADVLLEAIRIFAVRNEKRQDKWRQAGWKGNLVEMRKKLDRLWAVWEGPVDKKDIDEALDLINAAAFYIRCVREDLPDGDWPWPK